MAEGSHKAVVELMGRVDSLEKATRTAQKEISRLNLELEKAQRSSGKMSKSLDDNDSRLTKFGKNLMAGKAAVMGYAAAIGGAVYAIDHIAGRTRDFADATVNLTYDLGALAEAVDHGATQFQLAGAAADIQATSLQLSQEQVNELFAAVDKTAATHKRDFIPALEATTKAINKGNVDKLKALGLQVDMKSALEREATALGKTTKELTVAERQSAAFNEVMRAMNKELATQTKQADGLAFAWERWTNKTIDNLDQIALSVNNIGGSVEKLAGQLGGSNEEVDDSGESWRTWALLIPPVGVGLNATLEILSGFEGTASMFKGIEESIEGVIAVTAEAGIGAALQKGVDAINAARQGEVDAYNAFAQGMHADAWLAESRRLDAVSAQIFKKEQARKNSRGARRPSAEKSFDAFEFTSNDISELQGGVSTSQVAGESDMTLSESAETFASRHVERERLKNDLVLEEKLRALEVEREMGVDPIAQIEREEQALLDHNEFLLDTTSDDIARLALHDQRRQIVHEAQIKRIAAERAAERKKLADLQTWTSVSGQLLGMQTQTATMAAETSIKSDERRAKFVNRARGIEALGIGALQVVQAAAAAASFNIPQAILHSAAAAVAFTQGGLLISGALDQRAGGSAGRMPTMSGGGGMGSTGGGVGGGQRREGLVDQINSDVPPSPNPRAPTTASRKEQGRGGGMTFNGPIHLYGTPEDEWLENLSHAQAKFARNNPEAA